MPDSYKPIAEVLGYKGDTIPNFLPAKLDYILEVPLEYDGIPALIVSKEDLDSKVQITRAKTLSGSVEDRTITINTAAEDDTTLLKYTVLLNKEKDPDNIQPYYAEPFISQFVNRAAYNSSYIEICNPGNQPLDLSDYMITCQYSGTIPGAIAANLGTDQWNNRYNKYIPGYKWQDEANWQIQPGIAVQDLAVNPMVAPGDVFVLGKVESDSWHLAEVDINFANNPWGENIANTGNTVGYQYHNNTWYLFKLVGPGKDSIKSGLKPVGDANDFELIDIFGNGDGKGWVIGGVAANQVHSYTRKPAIYHGNSTPNGSFGTNSEDSEWLMENEVTLQKKGYGWPNWRYQVPDGIGSHFMNEVNVYKSTVASLVYKVSEGYSMNETIRGVVTGTTVSAFTGNLIKINEKQTLTLKSAGTGATLTADAALNNGDLLVVLSADSVNTTQYTLTVTHEGLSSNAILTSATLTITINGSSGLISGFPYGTNLKSVVDKVVVPAGASFTVADQNDAYVSFKRMNYDTTYVDVKVNDQIYFEVVAENGTTKILYQLSPTSSASDAFVTSDLYDVNQTTQLIQLVPRGTSVEVFMDNVVPAPGATMKLIDKAGFIRTSGNVYQDDKLVVTSSDGKNTKVYYMSMLWTEYTTTQYLAYVLSNVYPVDQQTLTIKNLNGFITHTEFFNNIIPAFGASVVVLNSKGVESTSPDLDQGDYLKVTAADGETVVYYTLEISGVIAEELGKVPLNLYPNPSTGLVNIKGIQAGNRIRVYNTLGMTVRDMVANSTNEVVSLIGQPTGMYMFIINNGTEIKGRYKVIIK